MAVTGGTDEWQKVSVGPTRAWCASAHLSDVPAIRKKCDREEGIAMQCGSLNEVKNLPDLQWRPA